MTKGYDIVGYTYRAANYCGSCIIAALPTGPGEEFDGWDVGTGLRMFPEENLDEIAAAFGIDRQDERSFDSGDFPKVIFASSVEDDDTCDRCGEAL